MFPCNFTKQACSPAVATVYSADFRSEEGEPESFQFQHEEVAVVQKSISPKNTAQGFVNVSLKRNLESTCSLKSNFSFDRDMTKERSSETRSPLPCDLPLPCIAQPFSSFGFKVQSGEGIDLTQQKSLQTPALTKSDVCVDVPEPTPPPCPPYSLQIPVGGLKHGFYSGVAPMQGLAFGSPIPTRTNSGKTNVEKQVVPKFPVFQANRKEALPGSRCKKKALHQRDVTAPEKGFTEEFKVVVSLPSVVFYIQDATHVMLKSKLHSANESCLEHLRFKVHGCTAKKEHGKTGNEAAFQFKKSEPEMQKALFLLG